MPSRRRRVAIMLDLKWPYKRHAGIFAGTQVFAKEHDWHSIIDEFAQDTLSVRRTPAASYDGVIARVNSQLAERARRLGVPVVNVWLSSPAWQTVPGVFADFSASGRLKAEHLLSRGLRNFAAITAYKNRSEEMELESFRQVVESQGYACVTEKIPQDISRSLAHWRKTETVIAKWMERWSLPIGVVARGEVLGRLIVQLCHERGWRVPQDVALIAGQNEEQLCEDPNPSITSMEFGYERIGYESAKLLQRLMDGEKLARKTIFLPPAGLVVRESTDFYAVKDELVAAAIEFISRNSHRRIGQKDVAHAVNAEVRTLQLRFRKVLNSPIATEIRRIRIERAKRELMQSDRAISHIARDVGFRTANRMCEIFQRELGVTPSEFRRRNKGETGMSAAKQMSG